MLACSGLIIFSIPPENGFIQRVYTPVTKTLLWEKNMGSIATRNFEGIALGPALPAISSTSYSVLLVADNGGGTQ